MVVGGAAGGQVAGRRRRHPPRRRTVGRRTQAARARPRPQLRRRHPPARRAGQLPRHPHPLVVGGAAPPDEVDRPDGQPRPCRARCRGHQGDRHRGLGRLGARRFVRDVPAGPRRSAGAARRRAPTVEGRGAPPVPPHEDHEAARGGELQERLEGERRRDPMGEVRRRRPASAAGARPADPRRPARRRLRPPGGADDRRHRRRPLLPVQRRDLLRRACRPDRAERHRQDTPDERARRHVGLRRVDQVRAAHVGGDVLAGQRPAGVRRPDVPRHRASRWSARSSWR